VSEAERLGTTQVPPSPLYLWPVSLLCDGSPTSKMVPRRSPGANPTVASSPSGIVRGRVEGLEKRGRPLPAPRDPGQGHGPRETRNVDRPLPGEMQSRGCIEDSVNTNRRALGDFGRALDLNAHRVTLGDVTEEAVERYATNMQRRNVRFVAHPRLEARSVQAGSRHHQEGSPRPEEIRHVASAGGFDHPFGGLVVPKEPKRLASVLTDEEIDRIPQGDQSSDANRSRMYAIVLLMLAGPRR